MNFFLFSLSLFSSFAASFAQAPWALIVTLAGRDKLSSYFEWSCRSIGVSSSVIDMLVFHESNRHVQHLKCASNVKFIDLGENGLATLVVNEMLTTYEINTHENSNNEELQRELVHMVSMVIAAIPRYLIEVKPMTGALFQDWLFPYSHWSYTDPDIIW